jgi:hypothetical protein
MPDSRIARALTGVLARGTAGRPLASSLLTASCRRSKPSRRISATLVRYLIFATPAEPPLLRTSSPRRLTDAPESLRLEVDLHSAGTAERSETSPAERDPVAREARGRASRRPQSGDDHRSTRPATNADSPDRARRPRGRGRRRRRRRVPRALVNEACEVLQPAVGVVASASRRRRRTSADRTGAPPARMAHLARAERSTRARSPSGCARAPWRSCISSSPRTRTRPGYSLALGMIGSREAAPRCAGSSRLRATAPSSSTRARSHRLLGDKGARPRSRTSCARRRASPAAALAVLGLIGDADGVLLAMIAREIPASRAVRRSGRRVWTSRCGGRRSSKGSTTVVPPRVGDGTIFEILTTA